MTKSHIFMVISLAFLFQHVYSEVFTAMADLEDLIDTEQALISTLENYVRAEEHKIDILKRHISIYQEHHYRAINDVQLYLSNPINAYTLVKRLTSDWAQVEKVISNNINNDAMANITNYRENIKFPSEEDLNGAAVALTRLQDTYRLDTSSLARGELNGIKYSTELTAADCFELGRQLYENGDYYHSYLWMEEAEDRLNREENETVKLIDILEYLAFSTYKLGNVTLALDVTNRILDIVPTHSRALDNKVYYEDKLKKLNERETEEDTVDDGSEEIKDEEVPDTDSYGQNFYEGLCRGEITPSAKYQAQLRCRYLSKDNPFLKLAPLKVEEAHLDPDIYVFHEVLSDDEIDTIKRLAHPRFQRATVQNSKTGTLEAAQYRISKSAFLKDDEHKHVTDVAQRVGDMTGLTMAAAEELQVVNYGIGGHYVPHFDFAKKDQVHVFQTWGTGNRIATVLFYMSDVEQGGATVFPLLKTALWPKKGTAAFWYNLHPSGDGDVRTRHAACPVLVGSKWVCNKWIHEGGQEFLRPCTQYQPPEELTV